MHIKFNVFLLITSLMALPVNAADMAAAPATAATTAESTAAAPAAAAATTAPPAAATSASPVVGDASAGQQKITTCAACHGQDGNSPIPANPNLAGQHPEYLIMALTEYQTGVRNNPIMAGMAAGLSAQDIADIAAHYSSQTEKVGEADPNLVKQGEALYRAGDQQRGIPACMACHGPTGAGNGPAKFPKVADQNPDYLIAALKEYQSGNRTNEMMNDIAQKLNDKDMQAVASYIYGLYPTGMKLPETPAANATAAPASGSAPAATTAVASGNAPAANTTAPASGNASAAATAPTNK